MPNNYDMKDKGFSLLELLLVLGILGVIAVFAVSLSHSARNLANITETKNRMKEIRKAAGDYYSGHRDLPAPPAGLHEVPVGASALNLEQKHRLDGWGRYFHYDRALDAGIPSRTDITGITVDGKAVAAVIISGGPNQTIESSNLGNPYSTAGDDIVLPVSVDEQALAIARNDLQILQSKAQAFDAIFAGINNDASVDVTPDEVDEDDCMAVSECPQSPTNDPNCGSATLDIITSYGLGCGFPFPVTSAAAFISDFYALGNSILLDPWLNTYAWGKPSDCSVADPCYHKFFSHGPDGNLGGGDDIVP